MNSQPFISIIVPCYKKAEFIDECLRSISLQIYKNWECIIINDGSPDNTDEVVQKWVVKDCRFKYYHKKNGGVAAARNFGIARALGKWILPIDADDKIAIDYCMKSVIHLESNKYKVVYGNAFFFGAKEGLWNLPKYDCSNLAKFNMLHNSCFFKKEDWKVVDGYDSNLVHGLEDWEFWINLLKSADNVKHLNVIGVYYRILSFSRTTLLDANTDNKVKMMRYIEKKHFDFFFDNLGSKVFLYEEIINLKSRFNSKYYFLYNTFINLLLKFKK